MGKLYAWGRNNSGQLGLGDTTNRSVPTQVEGFYFDIVSAGNSSFGIRNGKLYAWGRNNSGQLGLGDTTNRSVPTQVEGFTDWNFIRGTRGIRDGGKLYTWGSNWMYTLGLGEDSDPNNFIPTPTRVGSYNDWDMVSGCAGIRNGRLYTWGDKKFTGNGPPFEESGRVTSWIYDHPVYPNYTYTFEDNTKSWTPGQFNYTDNVRHEVNMSNRIRIVESNTENRVTLTSVQESPSIQNYKITIQREAVFSPTQVGSFTDWTFASYGTACFGIRDGGKLYAWGSNRDGATGLGIMGGSSSYTYYPTRVEGFDDWDMVSCLHLASFGIRDGKLYAWGRGSYGRLGLGDNTNRSVPTQVEGFDDWEHVSAGGEFSLGIRDGKLYAWGRNNYGQLGLGDTTNRNTPTPVGSGEVEIWTYEDLESIGSSNGWNTVSAGAYNSLGLGCDKGRLDDSYIQMADITCPPESNYEPVGYDFGLPAEEKNTLPFTGSYDGQDYKITNLNVNRSNRYNQALFGRIAKDGLVENIKFINPYIRGLENVGTVAGYLEGTVKNCHVEDGDVSGLRNVGGIAGYVDGSE